MSKKHNDDLTKNRISQFFLPNYESCHEKFYKIAAKFFQVLIKDLIANLCGKN